MFEPKQDDQGNWNHPVKYCPFCQCNLRPFNIEDVERGEADYYIWVHHGVYHDEDYDFTEPH